MFVLLCVLFLCASSEPHACEQGRCVAARPMSLELTAPSSRSLCRLFKLHARACVCVVVLGVFLVAVELLRADGSDSGSRSRFLASPSRSLGCTPLAPSLALAYTRPPAAMSTTHATTKARKPAAASVLAPIKQASKVSWAESERQRQLQRQQLQRQSHAGGGTKGLELTARVSAMCRGRMLRASK